MNALAAALVALAVASGSSGSTAPRLSGEYPDLPEGDCALRTPESARATVAECLACHEGSGSGHPVGLVYARFAGRHGLRAEAAAVAAGVFLPQGELRCTTCHDGRSRARDDRDFSPEAICRGCHAF